MAVLPRSRPVYESIRIAGKPLPAPLVHDLTTNWKKIDDLRDFLLAWFVDDEIPSGTKNGTNKTFALKYVPMPANSLRLYQNGFCLSYGADYVLAGATITMAVAPASTDTILAYYRRTNTEPAVASAAVPTAAAAIPVTPVGPSGIIHFADDETPSGTINGSNKVFTLAHTPLPSSSLIFVVSGAIQLPGTDFTLSGATVTLTVAPVAGVDWLRAWYRY